MQSINVENVLYYQKKLDKAWTLLKYLYQGYLISEVIILENNSNTLIFIQS